MRMKKTGMMNRSAICARKDDIICWSRLDGEDNEAHIVRTTNAPVRRGRGVIAENDLGWYRIRIPNGHKYHQEYFLTELRRAIYPMQLTPFCWRTERTRAQFFVDEYSVAAALSEADRTIEQPNGSKIEIVVEDYEPYFQLDDQLREKMANAMRNRYDTKKNSLDLSKFYAHEQLRNHYCPLNRPLLMRTAIEIIENSVPDLEELILNDNRIRALNYMSDFNLGERLPKLRALFLAKNLLKSADSLQFVNETNIVELSLTGTPFRQNYKEAVVYISEIRKRFPKLRQVDGIALPPQIGFDIDFDASEIPSPRYSFFVDPAAFPVEAFLLNYFGIYDSDNRQPLEMVYHEQALFSLTAKRDISRLANYQDFNRNLCHIREFGVKWRQLIRGKYDVVSILTRLPATKHDPRSFTVDFTLYTNDLVLLTTTGIFCEQDEQHTFSMKEQFMRSFHRSFIITKKLGGGFGIINDMLHINSLTRDQEKVAFVENTGLAPTVTSTPSAANTYAFTVPLNDTIADDEME